MAFFKLNGVFAGRYQLDELLGEGNSSEVWKVRDRMADDAVVVLKIYAPEKGLDDNGVYQFKRNFSLSQQLSHPHLLKASHFDVWEGSPYLIMPFCPHGSLARLLKTNGPFSERQIALLLSQIGSALETLHRQEPPVVHQDVKPENILRAQPDTFLLADYGISSQNKAVLPASGREEGSGTRAYAPPESFDPARKTDTSADIFSFGVTMFVLCTKKLPWGDSGGKSLLNGGEFPNLPEHYSAELNALLRACMSMNKAARPTADELAQKGKHFLETGSWNLLEKGTTEGTSSKKVISYLLATAVFALFMASVYWGYQNDHLLLAEKKPKKTDPFAAENQDIDQMLISTLEDELENLTKRTQELEKENKALKRYGPGNSILGNSRDSLEEEKQDQFKGEKKVSLGAEERAPVPDGGKTATVASTPVAASPKPAAAPPKEDKTVLLTKEFEEQLNKISDPKISGQARTAWKQETMARFAEGSVRIVDETEGTPKRYSASIFLNLLFNVPHAIEVKEIKTNQNRKVTELRLTMQAKM